MNAHFPTQIQELQFYDKYSRWSPTNQRRESWPEAVDRVIDFLFKQFKPGQVESIIWPQLKQNILEQKIMPSMRLLQLAGPALDRCNVGAYNCCYLVLNDLDAFSELLYILMQGTGVGYSVESRYIAQLPAVASQRFESKPNVYLVEDSTEGWCNALRTGMYFWFTGRDIVFDFREVRAAGSKLLTKGGVSAGPEGLWDLLTFARKLILNAQGRYLTSIECSDLANKIGWIVQVGGVRRSALLCLFDHDDILMRNAKGIDWCFNKQPYRMMSNNSAVYDSIPDKEIFDADWAEMDASNTGEPGIVNRLAMRPSTQPLGVNPCGEISLRPFQFCNLSVAVARAGDSLTMLEEKVRLATILGTIQSTLTNFNYIRNDFKLNCEEERLLGVDITGQLDCKLLQPSNPVRDKFLGYFKTVAHYTNRVWSQRLGINRSAAITCVKPSGNSSQLLNCSSGLHARFAKFYIRRFRIGAYTAIGKLLKTQNIPYKPETGHNPDSPTVLVFEFPVKAPEGAIVASQVSAEQQFANWLSLKTNYTDHNPSCTIMYDADENHKLRDLVYANFSKVGGLSFLPRVDMRYALAPYEEITEQQYTELAAGFDKLDFSQLYLYETEDTTTVSQEFACTSGQCDLL